MSHTKEPWSVTQPTETLHAIRGHGGRIVADVGYGDTFAINDANARRIVACVNACAGTTSEYLESGAVMVCGRNQIDYFDELKQQRDDLLETLESAYNIAVEHDGLFPFDWAVYCEMLHAAIDRAKYSGQPEEQAETAIPALIFYPAGSLGEEVTE